MTSLLRVESLKCGNIFAKPSKIPKPPIVRSDICFDCQERVTKSRSLWCESCNIKRHLKCLPSSEGSAAEVCPQCGAGLSPPQSYKMEAAHRAKLDEMNKMIDNLKTRAEKAEKHAAESAEQKKADVAKMVQYEQESVQNKAMLVEYKRQ